jgi:predicted PurR-regulated permease PerM
MTSDVTGEGQAVSPVWGRETRRWAAVGMVVGVMVLGLVLLLGILDSIIMAALLAFLVEPILRGLVNRLHFPKWLSILATYLVVAAVALGAVLVLPILIINSIAQIDFAAIVASFESWLTEAAAELAATDFLGLDLSGLTAIGDASEEAAGGTGLLDPGSLLSAFQEALVAVAGVAGLLIGIIAAIIFVLIIAVYLSAGSDRYFQAMAKLIPQNHVVEVTELGRRLNRSWNDYVRGQGIMILVIGFTTWVVCWLIGVPGALFLAVIAGLLEVIPTFGPIIATVPAVIIALIQGSTRLEISNLLFAVVVIIAYTLIQQLESNIIAPRVMGNSVQLPALVILISITAAYQLFGILGALLAVPVVANVRILLSYLWAKVHSRDPWLAPT